MAFLDKRTIVERDALSVLSCSSCCLVLLALFVVVRIKTIAPFPQKRSSADQMFVSSLFVLSSFAAMVHGTPVVGPNEPLIEGAPLPQMCSRIVPLSCGENVKRRKFVTSSLLP